MVAEPVAMGWRHRRDFADDDDSAAATGSTGFIPFRSATRKTAAFRALDRQSDMVDLRRVFAARRGPALACRGASMAGDQSWPDGHIHRWFHHYQREPGAGKQRRKADVHAD